MASVLFDEPGPRARARHRIYTAVLMLAIAAGLVWFVLKLDEAGQFESRIWENLVATNVWQAILDGLVFTLRAAAISIVTSVVFGLVFAIGRLSDRVWLRWPAVTVVEFFRAVPLLLLMVFIFFWTQVNLTGLDREDNALLAVVAGLTLYNGSVLAEVFRAGINAVPRGQSEAAYALGMRKTQVMTSVLTPQAVRFMLPAIISQCVVVLKDTSLGFVVTYRELVSEGRSIATFVGSQLLVWMLIALIFIALNSLLSLLATWLERRLASRGQGKQAAAVEDVVTLA
jgi:glutamate transport system permease protein